MRSIYRCSIAALALASAFLMMPLRAHSQTADVQNNPLARFPVAHEHASGWCLGYLYIYTDSIAYDVTWPATDKGHSFKVRISDLQQADRWINSGQQLKAVELKSGQSTYRFWWLANEQDVINGRAYQFNPPDAGDPDLLIAAIRNPASLNTQPPAASTSAAPATSANPMGTAGGESRFAVTHIHTASQCIGYLYVSAGRVRYEVAQPETDKKHSVDLPRSEITAVQQWILLGLPQNAVEIRTTHGNYHFWLLPDNADLLTTSPRQWGVRSALPATPLIAALQGQAVAAVPGVTAAGPIPAASGSAFPAAPAPAFSASPAAPNTSTRPMPSVAGPNSLGEYVYTPPQGWATNRYPDGIVLTSPVYNTGERCLISMWPMRQAGRDLFSDANAAFQTIFNTYELRNRTSDGMSMPQIIIRGTSGQGWDYVILKRGIGKPSSPAGSFETLQGFVLVARLNSNLAVISGLSKAPLVSSCFGELVANVWPGFFYSLRFRDWPTTDQAPAMANKLAGTWTSATGTAADQYQFGANGRYGTAAAVQNYNRISSTQVLETTQAFFGNGTYSLKENTITLAPDSGRGQPETGLLRLEDESQDNGRSWAPTLYLLRTSVVDGTEYEVRYQKK